MFGALLGLPEPTFLQALDVILDLINFRRIADSGLHMNRSLAAGKRPRHLLGVHQQPADPDRNFWSSIDRERSDVGCRNGRSRRSRGITMLQGIQSRRGEHAGHRRRLRLGNHRDLPNPTPYWICIARRNRRFGGGFACRGMTTDGVAAQLPCVGAGCGFPLVPSVGGESGRRRSYSPVP